VLPIAGRIIAAICPADVLRTRLVRWLFLSFLIAYNALLRGALVFRFRHACLAAMLATHVLVTFQIVFSWHLKLQLASRQLATVNGQARAAGPSPASLETALSG
jgi:hypothetical protein